jgi:3-oxoacyl-[acyl-carrier protein] reductase
VDAVIFANSGATESARVEDLTTAAWSKSLRRSATLPFLVSKAAVPVLRRAKDPRMVFLLPEGVRGMPEPGEAASITPKAALVGLLRTYALELGVEGVTANAVAFPQPGLGSSRVTRTPRAPDYKDVAAAVSFFLSPASGFITGKTLDVNGGRSML